MSVDAPPSLVMKKTTTPTLKFGCLKIDRSLLRARQHAATKLTPPAEYAGAPPSMEAKQDHDEEEQQQYEELQLVLSVIDSQRVDNLSHGAIKLTKKCRSAPFLGLFRFEPTSCVQLYLDSTFTPALEAWLKNAEKKNQLAVQADFASEKIKTLILLLLAEGSFVHGADSAVARITELKPSGKMKKAK